MDINFKEHSNAHTHDPEIIPHVLAEGELGAALEWKITNRQGEVTEHVIKRSESYLTGFLTLLQNLFARPSTTAGFTLSVTDIGGTTRYLGYPQGYLISYYFNVYAGATVTDYGIVVGTGTTAPTITDYKLVSQIVHGSSSASIQYGAVTFGAPASDDTTSQVTVTRNFANASGYSITVNEIGLYARVQDCLGNGTSRYVDVIRDAIVGGIAVPNGETLTINYRMQAVV